MSQTFDPYRKWLGIPPNEQPADHYCLLGIGRFEDDADTISNAADRQMAHVRTFQTGPHSVLSQRLLNEIAAARVCLLDRAKKAEYDARLRAKQALQTAQASPAAPPAPVKAVVPSVAPLAAPGAPLAAEPNLPPTLSMPATPIQIRATRTKKKRSPATGLVVGALLLAAVGVVAVIGRNGGGSGPALSPASQSQSRTVAAKPPAAATKTARSNPIQLKTTTPDTAPKSTESSDGATPKQPATPPALPPSQPKLEIVEAKFGTGDRWEDVTERMQSLVDDERLVVTVAGDLYQGVPDPALGVVKTTQIRFRAAGREDVVNFADGELVYLDGHPPQERLPSPQLQVLDARYGAGTKWIDVLPKLIRWVHGDRLAVRVDSLVQGDPVPNVRKLLFLRYRTADGEFVAHAWDGEDLVLDTRPITAAGKPTDLIAVADTEHDSTGGRWQKTGTTLVAPDQQAGNLAIHASLPDEYVLKAVVEGVPLPSDVGVTLPIGGRHVQLLIEGASRSASGLQNVDGAVITQNSATRRGAVFEPGQATFLQCMVRRSRIYATCNGRVVVDWRGDPNRLSLPGGAPPPEKPTVVLANLGNPWRLSRLDIAPLGEEPSSPVSIGGNVVDLLKQIELKLDTVSGNWQMTEKGLLTHPGESARLLVPYSPPDDYELRLIVERKSGNDGLFVGFVVDRRQTMVAIDGWGGNVSGLHFLDGQTAEHNATRYNGRVFADERAKELVFSVHPSSVRVTCDGEVLVDWHGDAQRLSMEQRMNVPDELGLALADWNTQLLISKFEMRPLPAQKPVPPVDQVQPGEKPRSLADLANKPAADNRLPVPTGKELAATEKKVAELFDPQWTDARTFADRLAVARKLYDTGAQTADNPALRYALLREASIRAAGLGDAPTVCEAIDQLGRDFQIDALVEKLTALGDASEKARLPVQVWTLSMNALVLSDRALLDERYDEARKFATLAAVAARKLRNHDLMNYAERHQTLIRGRQDRHARLEKALARLREQPDDDAANLTAGIELCLLRGDWQRGLSLLAGSGNARLAEIARLEMAAGQNPNSRAALIDAWQAEAPKQTGALRSEYELQAKYWLERGLPLEAPAPDAARKRTLDKLAAMPGISLARVRPGLDMAMFDGSDMQLFRARRVSIGLCHNFGFGSPDPSVGGDNFSVRWNGWIKPPLPGKYAIKTGSDDGIRLRINGNLVVDHWHRGAGDELVEVDLTDQIQPLSMEFNDTGATAAVWVRWALKDLSDFQVVPAEALFHDSAVGVDR